MIILPHIFIFLVAIGSFLRRIFTTPDAAIYINFTVSACLFLYIAVTLFLHIMPCRLRSPLSPRLKIMYGGRNILRYCLWGILIQFPFYLAMYLAHWPSPDIISAVVFFMDGAFCFLHFYLLALNGCVRILFTCRRLGIATRIFIVFTLWIPLFNLFLLKYMSQMAKEEFDQENCRFENRRNRDGSLACATRYPILMLHGIGFRDLRYFNYWGRIPKELVKNGAIVYYGHQEAWGTIEDNALIIKKKLEEILLENHCDKVNIIAHSKGGLDARYLISGLGMAEHVASLTTVSTPHRGSELLNILNRLPDSVYRFIASLFDKSFAKFGDIRPDCYHSSKQLSPGFCLEFNEKYPDVQGVYYQSYASIVKNTFGDGLLSIPNLLMFLAGAPKNDGLVTVDSAVWGNFRETFISSGRRGISHGDMIDLKRKDYRGFDVLEAYVKMASQLKEMGF